MFDWKLFLVLVLVCVPGLLVVVPGVLSSAEATARKRLPEGKEMPRREVMLAVTVVQSLAYFAIAAAAGAMLAPRVGLRAPFFEALIRGEPLWPALRPQLLPALGLSVAGALVFLAAYYGFFCRRLDAETVYVMDELRNKLGIWGRVLYGGVVEEVLIRWGLMTVLVWLGALLVGEPSAGVMWAAILLSGILFGLGHAPSYLAAGCRRTPMFFAAAIFLNLWAGTIFAWLYWHYGLEAAMIGHALFHLVWWPVDVRVYRGTLRPTSPPPGRRPWIGGCGRPGIKQDI
jgi:hypothetical protein